MKVASLLVASLYLLVCVRGTVPPCGPYLDSATQVAWESQNILAYPASVSYPSSFSYEGLTWAMNATGQLVVTESNGNVVFVAGGGPISCSSTSQCVLDFQNDGNLVIYAGGSGQWSTGTWSGVGRYVIFQTSSPYVTVLGQDCSQQWPTASRGNPTVLKSRTTTVLGPTGPITSFTSTALPAPKWKSVFSVNTHISQGWSSTMVLHLTEYLGVGAIRDSIPSGAPGSQQYIDYQSMNAAGIKLNVVAGGASNKTGLQNQVNAWATFQSATGMIQSIEGFNELNNFGFTYNGINPSTSYKGMYQAMADLYSLVKANSVLKNLPVYDMTAACFAPSSDNLNCYDITNRADYGNQHIYTGSGEQSISLGGSNNNILTAIDGNYNNLWTTPSKEVITETGWHTDTFSDGVSETAQAKLTLDMLLNSVQFGLSKTFIYELLDEVWAGYDGSESHFGIFHNDQTVKPAAKALHFLSSLLNDTGAGQTNSLTYQLTGFPYSGQRLLFQNTNKVFYLVLWNNLPVWNPVTNTDISNAAVSVTLTLPWSTSVNVYDIFSTASDTSPLSPISSTTSSTATFSMSDKVVVIGFSAPNTPTTAPTAAPTVKATAAPTKVPTLAPSKAPTSAPSKAPTTAPACSPNNYQLSQNNHLSSSSPQPVLTSSNCQYGLYISSTDGTLQIKTLSNGAVTYTSTQWSQQAGPFSLTMQADGNLVTYDGAGGAVWSTGTGVSYGYTGSGPFVADLQTSGKFQLLGGSSNVMWSSS